MTILDNCDSDALKDLLAVTPCGVTANDCVSHKMLYANDVFYALAGYSREDFRERIGDDPHRLLFPADNGDPVRDDTTCAMDNGAECEYRLVRGDGSVRRVKVNTAQTMWRR